ncbi:MAG: acyl-CoA synthetase FdrA [Bacillota bacterium]
MSFIKSLIIKNTYRDSVFLMKISSQASQLEGVEVASAMMATERNKDLFKVAGLYTEELEKANPDDLAIAVSGANEEILVSAIVEINKMLTASVKNKADDNSKEITRLEHALLENNGLNLVLISVAGDYAKYEAAKALAKGLNVMLYSDNISLEDELRLKKMAQSRGLMVMGPDCGTAILNGVPLAFANKVSLGNIGIVGASGTGIQEVSCLIDALGQGISQAIGTGGRDLKDAIGGITALTGLDYLLNDRQTKVIVLISKPPGEKVREKICSIINKSRKPFVVYYAGCEDYAPEKAAGAIVTSTLEETAIRAAALITSSKENIETAAAISDDNAYGLLLEKGRKQVVSGKYLRGIFGGGSLCYEAMNVLRDLLPQEELYSNIPLQGINPLKDILSSQKHTFLDMGEDEFTVGKPHPMIDPTVKNKRLYREILDPETAVVIFDVVIGYGSHPDPAGEIVQVINNAKAEKSGSLGVSLIASVCGTDNDIPSRKEQVAKLVEAGVIVMPSNAHAAKLAGGLINKIKGGLNDV